MWQFSEERVSGQCAYVFSYVLFKVLRSEFDNRGMPDLHGFLDAWYVIGDMWDNTYNGSVYYYSCVVGIK